MIGLAMVFLLGALAWSHRFGTKPAQAQEGVKVGRSPRASAMPSARPEPDERHRGIEAGKSGVGSEKPDAAVWPLPCLPQSEIAAKRAELLEAGEAAARIEAPEPRSSALARVCYQWAEFDPRGAVERAIGWQLEDVPGLLENLALQWASADLPAARAWTESQPPGEFRSELVTRIGFALAQSDPEAAANYVVREMEPGPGQEEAAISVLHQWLQKEPDAARAWVEEFPPGAMRDRALQEVAGMQRPVGGNPAE